MFTPDDVFAMSVRLKFGRSSFVNVDNFGLSEGETIDEEGIDISSYLGDSIVNPNTDLSMGRLVALDLPHVKPFSLFLRIVRRIQRGRKLSDSKCSLSQLKKY